MRTKYRNANAITIRRKPELPMRIPSGGPREPVERIRLPAREGATLDRLPRGGDEIEQEAQIMQAQQPQAENLLLVDEMADVRARELCARRAPAVGVERALVARETRVPEIEPSLPRQRAAGARRPRRQHAVEHVDAARDDLEHALRIADAHEVPRLLSRQERCSLRGRIEHRPAVLADAEPADRVAVEVERNEILRRAAAQLV